MVLWWTTIRHGCQSQSTYLAAAARRFLALAAPGSTDRDLAASRSLLEAIEMFFRLPITCIWSSLDWKHNRKSNHKYSAHMVVRFCFFHFWAMYWNSRQHSGELFGKKYYWTGFEPVGHGLYMWSMSFYNSDEIETKQHNTSLFFGHAATHLSSPPSLSHYWAGHAPSPFFPQTISAN